MAFQPNYPGRTFIADTQQFDVGLRRHMINVYNAMMLGLLVSGLVAFGVSHSPHMMAEIYGSGLQWVVMLLPLAFLLLLQLGVNNLSAPMAYVVFTLFSASMGLSLTWIFLAYTQQSIVQIFFVSAAMFAGTSLYGYTTKADLTHMRSFFVMGLWGLIIGGVANIFLHSGPFGFVLTAAGVVLFTGLTAFDTQTIRNSYSQGYGVDSNRKLAILGALSLYLDFINLFIRLLQLFGQRRS